MVWNFRYNINNGRYVFDDINTATSPTFDNSNWITKEEFKPIEEKPLPKLNPQDAWEDSFDY